MAARFMLLFYSTRQEQFLQEKDRLPDGSWPEIFGEVTDIVEKNYIIVVFVNFGWTCMVTGQSLVLFSRLHLIVLNTRKLRWILAMIIVDCIVFTPATLVAGIKVRLSLSISYIRSAADCSDRPLKTECQTH